MLLCDLIKDVSELLRAYPKLVGKPDCPYGMIRMVLDNVPLREVINHCTDTAIDISVDNYVTIRRREEKAEILRGIRTGMALVKGNPHAQTDQYYREDGFIGCLLQKQSVAEIPHVWVGTSTRIDDI